MKIKLLKKPVYTSICTLFVLIAGLREALPYDGYDDVSGKATNGISADIGTSYGQQYYPQRYTVTIYVGVQRRGETLPFQQTNATHRLIGGYYWGASNSFCGPMELKNESGKKIRPLKPEILLPESYPEKYNLRPLYEDFWRKKWNSLSTQIRCPGNVDADFLCKSNASYKLKNFHLDDYFKVKKTGEYKLTVWPIIYKRNSTNDDIYEKIDVPSVTVPIHITSEML